MILGALAMLVFGADLLDAVCQNPTTCIHALADDRNQELALGRFLDHSSVS
jgi:hypothetical protein